ncbi:MAG: DegT/DnrJ/EryC1/StrS family aminotransferase [Saprospiraceae bacterium]
MKIIPYGKQHITDEDVEIVIQSLKGDLIARPNDCRIRGKFSAYIGCKYSVAVANGTAALHLAAMALDVDETSNVICSRSLLQLFQLHFILWRASDFWGH